MSKRNLYQNGVYSAAAAKSAKNVESTQWSKYHTKQGHGFAAEDSNALYDRLCNRNVDKVGLNNELNGADRLVNGCPIQTKYCKSAYESVCAAFDSDGIFRYPGQKIEVPKGQGREAIEHMANKIKDGKVPGVTDPSKASEMIVEGNCSYDQAVKIAKAGNLESIKFDVKNQMVTCLSTIGISFVIGYAISRLSGINRKEALESAISNAVRTGCITLSASVATQQILRTSVGRKMAAGATRLCKKGVDSVMRSKVGREVIEKMMASILGKAVTQSAARNALIKISRSNLITATFTTAAQSIPDIVKACRGRKSWKQVAKNAVVNTGGMGGGSVGFWIGSAAGSVVPVVGTTLGGFVGAIGGGLLGSMGTKKIMDYAIDDDVIICMESVTDAIARLSDEFNVTENRLESILQNIKSKNVLKESLFERIYKAGGTSHSLQMMSTYTYSQLRPYFA